MALSTDPPFDLAAVARIAVVRVLPGLGDMLCLVPALRSLRSAAPHARVTLVGLESSRWMAERYPELIDDLRGVDHWPGVPEADGPERTWPATRTWWEDERFDFALQLHGNGRTTNAPILSLPAGAHAGHHPEDTPPPGPLFRPWPSRGRESERLAALVLELGGLAADDELDFPVRRADEAAVRAHLHHAGPYACIHPGASRPDRRWPREEFARVGDHLARLGLRVLITGTSRERSLADDVRRTMRENADVVAGATDLGSMAALLRDAEVSVSNDTGVAHLASAVDARAVVIFTTSDAERWAPLPSPRRRAVSGVGSRSVDEVIAAVDGILCQVSTR